MELTSRQKTDAVAEAYTARSEAREIYAKLAAAGDEDARRKLEKIDRELEKLKAEDRRLEAERRGGGDPAVEAARRAYEAHAHTLEIEREFRADLAAMGHGGDHTPAVRRRIEEEALARAEVRYGPAAAERCRGLLAPAGDEEPTDEEPTVVLDSIPVLP